jgi:transcriptional regulator with XRE-family HTH domain
MHTIDVTPKQISAGRKLLGWSQTRLAEASGTSRVAISKLEAESSRPQIDTLKALVRALEDAGVELVPGGVRLANGISTTTTKERPR